MREIVGDHEDEDRETVGGKLRCTCQGFGRRVGEEAHTGEGQSIAYGWSTTASGAEVCGRRLRRAADAGEDEALIRKERANAEADAEARRKAASSEPASGPGRKTRGGKRKRRESVVGNAGKEDKPQKSIRAEGIFNSRIFVQDNGVWNVDI